MTREIEIATRLLTLIVRMWPMINHGGSAEFDPAVIAVMLDSRANQFKLPLTDRDVVIALAWLVKVGILRSEPSAISSLFSIGFTERGQSLVRDNSIPDLDLSSDFVTLLQALLPAPELKATDNRKRWVIKDLKSLLGEPKPEVLRMKPDFQQPSSRSSITTRPIYRLGRKQDDDLEWLVWDCFYLGDSIDAIFKSFSNLGVESLDKTESDNLAKVSRDALATIFIVDGYTRCRALMEPLKDGLLNSWLLFPCVRHRELNR